MPSLQLHLVWLCSWLAAVATLWLPVRCVYGRCQKSAILYCYVSKQSYQSKTTNCHNLAAD